MEELITKEFFIPNLKDKINKFVQSCVTCIISERKTGKSEGFLHPIDKEYQPLSTFHLDHLGPMPSTSRNYKHILTIVDAFTKFTWIFPVKATTTDETIKKLMIVTGVFGNPSRIIADRGPAFTSNAFQDFCNVEQIELVHTTTGVPRGNGQVERIHRTIIPVLTKLSISDAENWFKHVQNVQLFINKTYNRAIGMSPAELLFGTQFETAEEHQLKEIIEQEIAESYFEDRDSLRSKAKAQILRIQQENQKSYNAKRKAATMYKIGDHVAIRRTQFGTGLKVKPKNFGPYKIVKVKGNERYTVQKVGTHEGPFSTETSADNMTLWPQDERNFQICMLRRIGNFWRNLISPEEPERQRTIVIEGNIAAGKTTLTNWIRDNTNYLVIPEPIHLWHNINGFNLLEAYYNDRDRYAVTFQFYALLTMLKRHLYNGEQQNTKVMERSLLSTQKCVLPLLLQEGMIDQHQFDVFNKWIEFIEHAFDIPIDTNIYLRTTPEISFERIQTRDRPGESNITLSYLTALHNRYDSWLLPESEIRVYQVNANDSPIAVVQAISNIFRSLN